MMKRLTDQGVLVRAARGVYVNPLARSLLSGEINDGDTVIVGFNDITGELLFNASPKVPATV